MRPCQGRDRGFESPRARHCGIADPQHLGVGVLDSAAAPRRPVKHFPCEDRRPLPRPSLLVHAQLTLPMMPPVNGPRCCAVTWLAVTPFSEMRRPNRPLVMDVPRMLSAHPPVPNL